MKVADVMTHKVAAIGPDTTYEEAVNMMEKTLTSALPIIDADNALVGIVSEKDLFRALYPDYSDYFVNPGAYNDQDLRTERVAQLRARPVSEFMTKDVETITPDMPLMIAGGHMIAHRIHALPVLDVERRLVGMITREQVFRVVLREKLGQHGESGVDTNTE